MGLDHALLRTDAPTTTPDDDVAWQNVITWRKENWLHRWFVDHVNGGEDEGNWLTECSLEQLAGLAMTLARVDREHRADLLPPQSGFFFGSTEVDEWYWKNIKQERADLERVLDEERAHVAAGNPARRYAYWCWW